MPLWHLTTCDETSPVAVFVCVSSYESSLALYTMDPCKVSPALTLTCFELELCSGDHWKYSVYIDHELLQK